MKIIPSWNQVDDNERMIPDWTKVVDFYSLSVPLIFFQATHNIFGLREHGIHERHMKTLYLC